MAYFETRSAFLTTMAYDKKTWNNKLQGDWQVPYRIFGHMDMNCNNKNFKEWMYFDGMLMSGDGNLNLAYCGVYMNLPRIVLNNFTIRDDDRDIFWMEYGEAMAREGR